MNQLKFCPQCGNESLQWDNEKKWNCKDCNFVLYHNCAAAVAVLIRFEDEILLTRRNQNPAIGKLDLPGGFTDPKESAEETCRRELEEEMGVNIDIDKLEFIMSVPNIYHYKGIDYNTLDMIFVYPVDDKFDVQLEKSEISEIVWLKKEELKLEDIAFESQRKFFDFYLNHAW